MLSGLLHPTSGEARVLGHVPWKREDDLLRNITLVMGNRSQLVWDIPAADSFRVIQEIFRLPEHRYQHASSVVQFDKPKRQQHFRRTERRSGRTNFPLTGCG